MQQHTSLYTPSAHSSIHPPGQPASQPASQPAPLRPALPAALPGRPTAGHSSVHLSRHPPTHPPTHPASLPQHENWLKLCLQFSRTVGSETMKSPALIALMATYKWTKVVILTSTNEVWFDTALELANQLQTASISVLKPAAFDSGNFKDAMLTEIKRLASAQYAVTCPALLISHPMDGTSHATPLTGLEVSDWSPCHCSTRPFHNR